jgi:hypothetical protein
LHLRFDSVPDPKLQEIGRAEEAQGEPDERRRGCSRLVVDEASVVVALRASNTQPPAAMTLRAHSVRDPYVNAMTNRSDRRKARTGVR